MNLYDLQKQKEVQKVASGFRPWLTSPQHRQAHFGAAGLQQ